MQDAKLLKFDIPYINIFCNLGTKLQRSEWER